MVIWSFIPTKIHNFRIESTSRAHNFRIQILKFFHWLLLLSIAVIVSSYSWSPSPYLSFCLIKRKKCSIRKLLLANYPLPELGLLLWTYQTVIIENVDFISIICRLLQHCFLQFCCLHSLSSMVLPFSIKSPMQTMIEMHPFLPTVCFHAQNLWIPFTTLMQFVPTISFLSLGTLGIFNFINYCKILFMEEQIEIWNFHRAFFGTHPPPGYKRFGTGSILFGTDFVFFGTAYEFRFFSELFPEPWTCSVFSI